MEGTSFIAQDVNLECSFSDLLVRRPKVSDKALHVEAVEQPKVKTTRKRWTPEESEQLKTLYYEGKRVTTIADSLGRTVQAVQNQIRKLKLRRFRNLSVEHIQYLKDNYWLHDVDTIAKRIQRKPSAVIYYAEKLGLKRPKLDDAEPPIPRRLMPYDMVKRVAILERNCPDSKNRVDDSVVIFYDKKGPSAPMMAMHLDELCSALDAYFGRRAGVTASALTHGYKAV
ncbi:MULTISPECIES: helix-turn-helix domain-containing protein [Vibrio harveyi group]|uniref:helix-turn-helix domain-containing protein n=1 Tax=Vibrio harveyi group TaxID=717610 RepID=UPI00111F644E|nr:MULTISPECIES: helix-turn-helix domain-containing protein [Vibrio harveyi group]EGQ8066720.1 helix-turn-helix domain-containing protein [Vibrio parahaemolyticus]EGQ9113670.1 gcrA cell cycle regulator family protein [Vibrio alginolyticus]EIU7851631.1 helix-turn-helix domain-containing protein [Vibrio parahaemolyticus]EIZ1318026.1 helix-turn-helix domain-containing protein [Vibrio parahaemolyticus]EJG1072190.1 helix-turn-helix domain-containing protein [Vibrio parahaemolyticus]